jgi:hypothetical protein
VFYEEILPLRALKKFGKRSFVLFDIFAKKFGELEVAPFFL